MASTTTVKLEEMALSTHLTKYDGKKGDNGRFSNTSSSHSHSHTSESNCAHSDTKKDERGYQWCDPTHDNHCHCCGHTGHIAAQCVTDMSSEIKEWGLGHPGKDEQSMYV